MSWDSIWTGKEMGIIFKLIASVSTLAMASLLAFESARRGVLIFATIIGVIKILIVSAFVLLLIVIVYLLLSPQSPRREREGD